MIFGFNTDVRVGKTIFHVQTEDRGKNNPVIDTTIYVKGQVFAKRASSYKEFLESAEFSESALQGMLERQHKQLIEEIRRGALEELAQFRESGRPSAISVQLLNPGTFVKGTTAKLQVAVVEQPAGGPVPGAAVRVLLNISSDNSYEFDGVTDQAGLARFEFKMPPLGPGGAQFVIQASSSQARDEITYNLRPKPKPE
jgi:hypothetical protein